ncbi:dual specificity phosphatase 12 [Blyttiomyces sp. JEL0837]|nr:dual specificity phosphatase 12 [Blyttiomyces sp. JEL0837]
MNEVVPSLFLSSFDQSQHLEQLQGLRITHVVSIGLEFQETFAADGIKYLIISLPDEDDANIIQHFDDCHAFLRSALDAKGAALVHCVAGVSRGPTIVAAYLMRELNCSVDFALEKIRQCRPAIRPNDGFSKQLELYYEMGCRILPSHSGYRRFLVEKLAVERQVTGSLTPTMVTRDPDTKKSSSQNTGPVLKCKSCRRILADSASIMEHEPGEETSFSYAKRKKDISMQGGAPSSVSIACSSYFIEPMEWMQDILSGPIEVED